jgi:hypothetical protein
MLSGGFLGISASRIRTGLPVGSGLVVSDHALVGDLGLLGEPVLGLAKRVVGGPDPGRRPGISGRRR